MIIDSRLGRQEVDEDKIILFPRGLIGFEHLRRFTLLPMTESSPFLVLQSVDDPAVGLLVADPYSFLPDFSLIVGDSEQSILQADSHEDLAVLVTVSIPPGQPDKTALNLLGPIVINHALKKGLQVPQPDSSGTAKHYIKFDER